MSSVNLRIKQIIAASIAGCRVMPEALVDELHLVTDLGATSLEKYEMAMKLEDAFVITLSDEAIDEAQTVGDVIAMVDARAIGKLVRE